MRRVWLLAALFGLGLAAPLRAEPSLQAFRDEVLTLLARTHPEWGAKPDAEDLMIDIGPKRVWLDNLMRRVRDRTGADREHEIVSFCENADAADVAVKSPAFAQARPRLRPQLAPVDYLKNPVAAHMLHRDFPDALVVAYALDEPTRFSYVMTNQLESWSVDEDAVRAAAMENLDALAEATPVEAKPSRGGAGRYVAIEDRDGYGAARIVCPRFVAKLHAQLGPRFRFAIPNRDFLVAWTPDFDHRREFAAQVAKDFASRPHPLSGRVFVADEAGVRLEREGEE